MRSMISILFFFILTLLSYGLSEFETILASYGNLSTVAGTGLIPNIGSNGWDVAYEGGPATNAELSRPHITMADRDGNLYIADKDAHAIRKVTTNGIIITVAGTNLPGDGGDEPGLGTTIALNRPNGLYTLPDGTTYILDRDNSKIRKLDTNGTLTTIVSDPLTNVVGRGLWVSEDETEIYYCLGTNTTTGIIRKWTPSGGITTYATGFVWCGYIDVDPTDGNLVVTDRGGHRVYRVFTNGTKTVIAGNGTTSGGGDGELALNTGLDEVRGVYFAPNGGYYLATHRGGQIWYVDTAGIIHLLVDGDGTNVYTHAGDGEPLSTPGKKISEPRAVTLAPNGDLIITENDNGFVRVAPRILVVVETSINGAGDFSLGWSSLPAVTNKIEARDNLITGNWQVLSTVPGADSNIVTFFTDTNTANIVKRFYRITELP